MPAPNLMQRVQEVPLKMVGGCNFGRFPKISDEQTWNFIVSDGFLVPHAGYKSVITLGSGAKGRGIYAAAKSDLLLAIIGSSVWALKKGPNNTLVKKVTVPVGTLSTSQGGVYIAENNNGEIIITDKRYVYVYDYVNGTFTSNAPGGAVDFPDTLSPGYVSFQNGRFIIPAIGTQLWYLSAPNDGETWTGADTYNATIQSKPGAIQAAVPMPGGGNNILILGTNVAESWQDLGLALFPYQRNSTFNVDYGCLNPDSIASLGTLVVWLAVNEQSGPVIMMAEGSSVNMISTDGINYQLSQLQDPEDCTGFLFKQDGHLLYQFTFITDNISYVYDFNTQLFSRVSNEEMDYHIARQVAYYDGDYYFVSLNGGNVYQFGTQYTSAIYEGDDEKQIPRIRVTPPLRLPTQRPFICKSAGFTVENGEPNRITTTTNHVGNNGFQLTTEGGIILTTEGGTIITTEGDGSTDYTYVSYSESIDMSLSRDGAVTFGNSWRQPMNRTGQRKSRFIYQRLGRANDLTFQFRFHGFGRFVAMDGIAEIYE